MPKGRRLCLICHHRYRSYIDRAIVSGKSVRYISSRYKISTSSVQRHKVHIKRAVAKAKEKKEIITGITVWKRLEQLLREAERQYKSHRGKLQVGWFQQMRQTMAMGIKLGMEARHQQQTHKDVTPAVQELINKVME